MAQEDFTTARIVNIILGVWLVVSAFLWPHSYAQLNNTLIAGVLCVAFALVAMRVPEVRYLNAVLAVWLFVSVWALPVRTATTQWNNGIVAIAIFLVSLAPAYVQGPGSRRSATPRV